MLQKLHALSLQRSPWVVLALSALGLELLALYFQYGLLLDPCIKCIYIRVAVAGILVAGLLGACAPRSAAVRWLAVVGWLAAAGYGLWQAAELLAVEEIVRNGGYSNCARFAGFPGWMPLDQWWPAVFEPRGVCGDVEWQFLGRSMAFWTWVAMGAQLLAGAVIAVAQGAAAVKGWNKV